MRLKHALQAHAMTQMAVLVAGTISDPPAWRAESH